MPRVPTAEPRRRGSSPGQSTSMRSRRWVAGRSNSSVRAGSWRTVLRGSPASCSASRSGVSPTAERRRRRPSHPVPAASSHRLVGAEAGVGAGVLVRHDREVAVLPVGAVDGHVGRDPRTSRVAPHEHPVGPGLPRIARPSSDRVSRVVPGRGAARDATLPVGTRIEGHDAERCGADQHRRDDPDPESYDVASAPTRPAPPDQPGHVGGRHGPRVGLVAEGSSASPPRDS